MKRPSHALAAYAGASLVATWPLARGLGRDVAWDLGDSVLNMWILAWDAEQLLRILSGDLSRLRSFFDANIFHPVPLALAYSEHLVAQALQILPVYAVSGNPILSYNLLFLSTFVLSGLGMYLLVRQLTGNAGAAFVSGLLFAFAPYRLAQSSHLQVLSSQWMPFVLYGLARYFETRRLGPLAGAAGALTLQNLSCGYYLLYFPPFAAAAALWEIARRRLWRDTRVWLQLGSAALVVVLVTTPFVLPYAALRSQWPASRSIAEVSRFSADVYSYVTAFPDQRLWGDRLQMFPKPEGELFPGAVPVLLALIGTIWWRRRSQTETPVPERAAGTASRPAAWAAPRWFVWLLATAAAGHGAAAVITLALRRIIIDTGPFVVRLTNINQLLLRAAAAFGLLLLVSPATRRRAAVVFRDRGFFLAALLAAVWLSLGPSPQALGRPLELVSPYRWLFDHVPGFDGVRVPARFAMIAACMLSVLAGYGAAVVLRLRAGRTLLVALTTVFVLEATHVPFAVNGMTPLRDFNTPEARLYRPGRAPAVYREMARQPPGSVLVELPLGQPDYDLRAMYYSIVHWQRLVNGYSGFAPPHYGRLTAALSEIPRHPDLSLQALRASGATHVILHEAAYLGEEGSATAAVLTAAGAVELFRDRSDVIFLLPR